MVLMEELHRCIWIHIATHGTNDQRKLRTWILFIASVLRFLTCHHYSQTTVHLQLIRRIKCPVLSCPVFVGFVANLTRKSAFGFMFIIDMSCKVTFVFVDFVTHLTRKAGFDCQVSFHMWRYDFLCFVVDIAAFFMFF